MAIISAAHCEVEIQEQTIEGAAAKYVVILSYEPEGEFSKEIISIVLTNHKPHLKETVDNGNSITDKKIFNTDGIINDQS